jgi:hypothetical protein
LEKKFNVLEPSSLYDPGVQSVTLRIMKLGLRISAASFLATALLAPACAQWHFSPDPLKEGSIKEAVDSTNHLIVAAEVGAVGEVRVVKFNTDGSILWANDGPPGWLAAMTQDQNGDIVLCGTTNVSSARGDDLFVRKVSSSGVTLWNLTYNTSADNDDSAFAVAIDSGNNIVIGGAIRPSVGTQRAFAMKFNPSGTKLWFRTYTAAIDADCSLVVVDPSDNIYIVGEEFNGDDQTVVVAYDSNGIHKWVRLIVGYNPADAAWLPGSGQVCILGTNGFDRNALISITPTSSVTKTIYQDENGAMCNKIRPFQDGANNKIAVVGQQFAGTMWGPMLLIYDQTSGALLVKRSWKNGATVSHDGSAVDVVDNGFGSLLVGCNFQDDADPDYNNFALTYSKSGVFQGAANLGPTSGDDRLSGIALAPSGAAYFVGVDGTQHIVIAVFG